MDESLGHARYCLGLVGSFLAVSFYASPLASLPHVIRSKSSDVLPFPIILTSFIGKPLPLISQFTINTGYLSYSIRQGKKIASIAD